MRWRAVFSPAAAAIALIALSAQPAQAQTTARSGPTGTTAPAANRQADPFARNAMGIEIAGGVLTEAWNFNSNYEWIGEGTFSVNWSYRDGQTLVVEFHAAGINQSEPRNAFLNAIVPNVRFRVWSHERWTMFVEVGAGASWSDTTTPPRGTRFNFLLMANTGFMYRLTPQIQ